MEKTFERRLRDAAIAGGHTATDQWALALSDVGVRVQSGETASEISTAVARQAELLRQERLAAMSLAEDATRAQSERLRQTGETPR